MSIDFSCDKCGQQFEAPDDMIGDMADCPECKNRMIVPAKSKRALIIHGTNQKHASDTPKVVVTDIRCAFGSVFVLTFKVIISVLLISSVLGIIAWVIFIAFLASLLSGLKTTI